mgnify:CR=1 FL=1
MQPMKKLLRRQKQRMRTTFIETLPGGYQMELNEDASNVSQGQKQLLTIARAILADNPILILDEATSALDNESEYEVAKSLEKLSKGRTTITIAHRLSSIRNSDRILVLTQEGIAEEETTKHLWKRKAFTTSSIPWRTG